MNSNFPYPVDEHRYRDRTARLSASMPGLYEYTYTCKSCGQRKSAKDGRKQVVSGKPSYGFRCIPCHEKREAKKGSA